MSDTTDGETPSEDKDKPVSLDPLEFEEALKALLAVDPNNGEGPAGAGPS